MRHITRIGLVCEPFTDIETRIKVEKPVIYVVPGLGIRYWDLESVALKTIQADFPFTIGFMPVSNRHAYRGSPNTAIEVRAPTVQGISEYCDVSYSTASKRLNNLGLAIWHAGLEF